MLTFFQGGRRVNEASEAPVAFVKVYVEELDRREMVRLRENILTIWQQSFSREKKGFLAEMFQRNTDWGLYSLYLGFCSGTETNH